LQDWYYEVEWTENLKQGQIILNCPIQITELEDGKIVSSTYYVDVIILTQSCDLANNKVENIVLAELIDIPYTENKKQDTKTLDQINKNERPRYHLIKEYSNGDIHMKPKLVDFGSIHTIPIEYLSLIREKLGNSIALNSPYREFVSQRFGAFFSRIGLPNGINSKELQRYIENMY